MPGESLSFDITADDRASSKFRDVGRAAADAGTKIDFAAASMKVWNDTAIKQGKAASTTAAAMKTHSDATKLLADAENVLSGRATTTTKLLADQGKELENTGAKAADAANATSALAGTGGGGVSGMGALIGAGVALAPILATVGTGMAGLGIAAYGIAKPIANAAQATGGLQANMHKLNPEQQTVARGLLSLGKTFGTFEQDLQPVVLGDFSKGLQVASGLLHDIEPVTRATGKAFGGLLSQIGGEFASGEWQRFFGFMSSTAGPDVRLLSQDFVGLLQVLPPLLEGLQPVATTFTKIVGGGEQTIRVVEALVQKVAASHPSGQENVFQKIGDGIDWLENHAPQGHKSIGQLIEDSLGLSNAARGAGQALLAAGPDFFSLGKAVSVLNADMTNLTGNLLTLQGSELGWKQALQSAQAQLKSNTAGTEGNSKSALANKAAILQSTNSAISFASEQLTLGKNIDGASRTVQAQIRWLQSLHDKSAFVRSELEALRKEEALLNAQRIRQTISVQGLGQWSVSQSLAPGTGHRRAAGGLIPGAGSADNYPALLTPGEVVVPKGMVGAGAVDHLRGKLPGFASGGLVPSYAGNVAGLRPWIKADDAATIKLFDQAVVKATVAGISAARSASQGSVGGTPGPGGGDPAANAALARQLYAAQLTPQSWTAWNYVAMRESGWNQFARNPSSGAYGIAQALPPTKYPFAGQAAGGSNPRAQITWMWNYMAASYGGPLGAAAHEAGFNWYDKGGWLKPGLTLAYNGTGKPEMVVPNRGGGAAQEIVLRIEGSGNDAVVTEALLTLLRKAIRTRGGSVQQALGRS